MHSLSSGKDFPLETIPGNQRKTSTMPNNSWKPIKNDMTLPETNAWSDPQTQWTPSNHPRWYWKQHACCLIPQSLLPHQGRTHLWCRSQQRKYSPNPKPFNCEQDLIPLYDKEFTNPMLYHLHNQQNLTSQTTPTYICLTLPTAVTTSSPNKKKPSIPWN